MPLVRLTSANDVRFQFAWELYNEAFPKNERRELYLQIEILNNPKYHFEIILEEAVFVGFILWWQFEGIRFIEHLAIHHNLRNKAYGTKIVEQFTAQNEDLILLEVEIPDNEIKKRRIAFYERLGFKLNQYYYQQLPMQTKGEFVDMLIMSYPARINSSQLSYFKENFRKECYTPYF